MVTQLFNQEQPPADACSSLADCPLVGDLVRIAEEGGTFDLNRCGCERCVATIADAVVNANFVTKLQNDAPASLASDSVPNVRLRLDPPLGSGGQGAVFFGVDPQTADCVAVKILSRGQCGSVESVSRVFHEAMWLKQLASPGLAELDRCGVTRNRLPFLSTRYVEGPTLRDVIQDRRRMRITRADRAAWALRVVSEILGTVSRMHERGIVHRDLKPANILMRHGRDPVLLDLGIAVSTSAERAADSAIRFSGTISYAAPERLRLGDQACDATVDVFSLGVMLRELAGLDGLLERGPADRMSPAMRELIAKATDDDAGQRFANAGEMLAAVEMVRASYERASGGRTRRTLVLGAVFALVTVTSVLMTRWLSSHPEAKLAIREESSTGSPRLPAVPPSLSTYGPREQLVEMRNSWAAGEAAVPEFELATRSLDTAKLYFGSIEPLEEWGYLGGDTVDGQVTAVATNPLELVHRSGRSKMVFVEPVGGTSRTLEWREEVLPRCGFSPNGNWVITFGLGRNFAVFDRRTLTQQFSGTLHSSSHEAPNISDDGEYISQVDQSGVFGRCDVAASGPE